MSTDVSDTHGSVSKSKGEVVCHEKNAGRWRGWWGEAEYGVSGVKERGSLKRSARAVQLFGRLAVLETHTLRY